MAAEETAEFVQQYVTELEDLTFNSKAIINTLTMLAGENKQAASGVAEAIEKRILTCPPAFKLPALYLLDSIVKNIGLPYTALFASGLPEVYGSVWHTAPETRPALEKLYNTWHRFFPSDVLARAESQRQPVQVAQPSVQYQAAHSFQQLSPGHASTAYPLQQRNSPQRVAGWPQYAQPGQYANSQPVYAQQQPGYQQQANQQPAYAQPQYQQTQHYQTTAGQYAAAYTPTYPQPQPQSDPHRPAHQSPGYPTSAHVSPSYPTAQPQPGGSQAAAMPEFLSQLIGAGVIPAAAPAPASTAASAGVALGTRPVAPTAFDPVQLKAQNQAAIDQLRAGTDANRAKFLDQRLHKQQKLAASAKYSRQWYANEKDWLAGTTADAQAAPAFFDELEHADGAAQKEEEASVPADPSQPICALSGERFDSFWDDASNGWRYKGATALDAEQAARYGLAEGTLVKVSCLGPPGSLEIGGAAEAMQASEGQETAEEVAAAAAAAIGAADQDADVKSTDARDGKHKMETGSEASPKRRRL